MNALSFIDRLLFHQSEPTSLLTGDLLKLLGLVALVSFFMGVLV